MRMEDINIGDVFLVDGGMLHGARNNKTKRPVKVLSKQKHYVVCETVQMLDSLGHATRPFKVGYFPYELNCRLEPEEVLKWANKSITDILCY